MATRRFNFSLSLLLGSSRRLYDALSDTDYSTAMSARRNAATAALSTGQSVQQAQTGHAGTLTKDQTTGVQELERLIAGARSSARLAFPDDPVKLHGEFQVGIYEPNTLDAELEGAGVILASCQDLDNVAALKTQGWTTADTTALVEAINQLSGSSLAKGDAFDDRIGLTADKIVAANAVYADALRIQNASRLQYPANGPGTETARARFLLDVFPPRERSEPSGGTQTASVPATPTPPPKTP